MKPEKGLGEKASLSTGNKRKYWSWIGGAFLLVLITGSIGVLVTKTAMEQSGEEATATTPELAQTQGRDGYGVPVGQPGRSNAGRNPVNQAGQSAKQTSDSKSSKQRTRIVSSGSRNGKDEQLRPDKLLMPEWEKIFNPGGTLKDDVNKNGRTGSNGVPDFMELGAGDISDEVIYNGAVRAAHDLGNAYVIATKGTDEHLRLYVGVERLITEDGTYIEFEFNQNPVQISAGNPWPLVGERSEGDLIVRMIFSNRILQSVEIEEWQQGGFQFVETGAGVSGNSCFQQPAFMYCVGPPPIWHPDEGFEVWDENYNRLPPTHPDDFVELGIDIDLLVGPGVDFAGVLLRTPEDIALNSFRVFEPLAQSGGPPAIKKGFVRNWGIL
jgi:hypothetical protein